MLQRIKFLQFLPLLLPWYFNTATEKDANKGLVAEGLWKDKGWQSPSPFWVSLQPEPISFWRRLTGCGIPGGLEESKEKERAIGVTRTKGSRLEG